MQPAQSGAPLPAPFATLLNQLDATTAEARDLLFRFSEEQVRWRPQDGKAWSIAECIDHLAKSNGEYAGAIEVSVQRASSLAAPVNQIRPGFVGRWFIKQLEPPPRRRFPAPKSSLPGFGRQRDEIWRDFEETQRQTARLITQSSGKDVNRIRFVNPFAKLIRFTVGTGLLVLVTHVRRHLWQAQRVTEATGFPRS